MEQQFQQLDAQTVRVLAAPVWENTLSAEAQIAGEQARRKAEVDRLLEEMRRESAKRKRRQRNLAIGFGSIYGLVVLGTIGEMVTHHFSIGGLRSIGGMGGLVIWAMMATKRHKNAAKDLARFNDPRSVGPLAEMLWVNDIELRPVIEDALIRLLPQLQAHQADLLNAEQRADLCRALNGKNVALTLAILKAFEQIGDEKALPSVEKLAAGEGKAAKESRVQTAAQECLHYLQPRIEQERARETLLRASDATQSTPDTLLRAAEGVPTVDPHQLLRADLSDESGGINP